jgi:putative radical SAM enzyme (TIGR03279 family)
VNNVFFTGEIIKLFIKSIDKNSPAYNFGLQIGDELVSINEEPVSDIIDYQYHSSEEIVLMRIKRNGNVLEYEIERDYTTDLGIVFEEIQYRHCGSKCPFCFVDQNPKGIRETLNFRDEDFRLSFMHGSYFTLNNVSKADLKRIVDQRLSPLYISVHALDRKIRNFLFGVDRDDKLLEKIEFLTENHIQLHTQIVLCPGINDRKILHDSITGLEKYYPGVKTVAIVPLGLTKHREGLIQFKTVTPGYSKELIEEIHAIQDGYMKKYDDRYVYLSDEWYLKAGQSLPSLEHYGDLFQLENGVGMTRQFLEELTRHKPVFKKQFSQPKKLTILTGMLAEPILTKHLVPVFEKAKGLSVTVKGVINEFYGSSINVSGLLSGSDLVRVIKEHSEEETLYLLPPNCFNPDNITLDDMTLESIAQQTGNHVMQFTGDYSEVRNRLENMEVGILN